MMMTNQHTGAICASEYTFLRLGEEITRFTAGGGKMNTQPLEQTKPPHWQRVREEREQLSERVVKLESFLDGESSLSISSEHLSLLRLQLAIMKQYEGVLGDRLDLWEKEKAAQK